MRISIELTPAQERRLIQIGLSALANQTAVEKSATKGGGAPWSELRREKYLAKKMESHWKADKHPKHKKRGRRKPKKLNSHALHTHSGKLRRDGKPLKHPEKQWTKEHLRNFRAAMKKKREEKTTASAEKKAAAAAK